MNKIIFPVADSQASKEILPATAKATVGNHGQEAPPFDALYANLGASPQPLKDSPSITEDKNLPENPQETQEKHSENPAEDSVLSHHLVSWSQPLGSVTPDLSTKKIAGVNTEGIDNHVGAQKQSVGLLGSPELPAVDPASGGVTQNISVTSSADSQQATSAPLSLGANRQTAVVGGTSSTPTSSAPTPSAPTSSTPTSSTPTSSTPTPSVPTPSAPTSLGSITEPASGNLSTLPAQGQATAPATDILHNHTEINLGQPAAPSTGLVEQANSPSVLSPVINSEIDRSIQSATTGQGTIPSLADPVLSQSRMLAGNQPVQTTLIDAQPAQPAPPASLAQPAQPVQPALIGDRSGSVLLPTPGVASLTPDVVLPISLQTPMTEQNSAPTPSLPSQSATADNQPSTTGEGGLRHHSQKAGGSEAGQSTLFRRDSVESPVVRAQVEQAREMMVENPARTTVARSAGQPVASTISGSQSQPSSVDNSVPKEIISGDLSSGSLSRVQRELQSGTNNKSLVAEGKRVARPARLVGTGYAKAEGSMSQSSTLEIPGTESVIGAEVKGRSDGGNGTMLSGGNAQSDNRFLNNGNQGQSNAQDTFSKNHKKLKNDLLTVKSTPTKGVDSSTPTDFSTREAQQPVTRMSDIEAPLLRHLEQMRSSGKSMLRFTLELAGGKSLKIQLHLSGGQVNVRFQTESKEMRRALENGWKQLSGKAAQRGIRLSNPFVDSKSRSKSPKFSDGESLSDQDSIGFGLPQAQTFIPQNPYRWSNSSNANLWA